MTLADAAARRLARTEFERPIVLVAGAGTGKTSTLVARVLAWSLGEGWRRHEGAEREDSDVAADVLAGIAAITFTERAAAEMGDRVSAALEQIRSGETPNGDPLGDLDLDPDTILRRTAALLVRIDALRVDTIHAFCRRILAGHALDAGLHPSFRIDGEGRIVPLMVEETLARWIDRAYGDPGDEDALALLESGHGPEKIAEALTKLVLSGVPPAELDRDPFSEGEVGAFLTRQAGAMESFLALTGERLEASEKKLDRSRRAHGALRDIQRALDGATSIDAIEEVLDAAPATHALGLLKTWRGRAKKKFSDEEKEAFDGLIDEITTGAAELSKRLAHIASLDPALHTRARRVLAPLLRDLRRDMTRQGVVTFDDLLHGAASLLAGSEDVRSRLRAGMDQFLIDEVQDTDPVQYDIITAIALSGETADRPGLFIVGDPKQSIYGFRSADLAAYEDFLSCVRANDGCVESLIVNFRSTDEILDTVGGVVGAVMIEEPGVQPEFEGLVPGREFPASQRRPVEFWPVGSREDGKECSAVEARRIEAEAIAEDIRAEFDGGTAWGDMAVLLRVTGNQEIYLSALREREIPYVVERDRSYFQRREIIDAISAVAAIASPHDHLSLVAWLRSPAVGLPDAALLPLWTGGLPGLASRLDGSDDDVLDQLAAAVDAAAASSIGAPGLEGVPDWPVAVKGALCDLAMLRRSFHEDPVDEFVALLRRATGQEETEACRFLGSHRLANLERFYRRLQHDLAEERRGGLHAILREHRHGVIEAFEEPESAPGDETLQAVRVMTIHRAKGLEFEQVFLADAHHGSGGHHAAPNDVGRADGAWEMRLLGAPSLHFDEIGRRRALREEAEMVRTLYVAMTRAEKRLVVTGKWPTRPGSSNHAELIARTRMPPPALLTTEPEVDTGDARWRLLLPGGERTPTASRRPEPIDVETVLRDVRSMETAAAHARERESIELVRSVTAVIEGEEEGPRRTYSRASVAPEVARAVGTALHAMLERHESSRPLEESTDVADGLLEQSLRGEALDAARAELRDLVRFAKSSSWLERFETLGSAVLGREVPILVADGGDPETVTSGAIDLLYRDPESSELVVADYKTDRPGKLFVQEQALSHEPQLRRYAEAIRTSLGLESTPRAEVWFLGEDEIVEVELVD